MHLKLLIYFHTIIKLKILIFNLLILISIMETAIIISIITKLIPNENNSTHSYAIFCYMRFETHQSVCIRRYREIKLKKVY